jgi:glutaconate CoA-transferase subunit A
MNTTKLISVQEAVARYVPDGAEICLGGIGAREPMAVVYELIRSKKRDLTLYGDSKMDGACMLVGAGCIKKLVVAYCWIGTVGSGVNLRRAVEKGVPNFVEVEEYSNFGMSLRYLAGAMNIPYLPTRSMLGSDLPTYNPRIKLSQNPYSDQPEPLALVPAANPDVAFIHVQRADEMGNCQIFGLTNNDINIARAAKKVIVTCEKLVSTDEIRKNPNMTAIPYYCVEAVAPVPYGAHPFFVAGDYWCDLPFRRSFMKQNDTQEHFEQWLDEWVYGVKDFDAYLDKLGRERLSRLTDMEHDNCRWADEKGEHTDVC